MVFTHKFLLPHRYPHHPALLEICKKIMWIDGDWIYNYDSLCIPYHVSLYSVKHVSNFSKKRSGHSLWGSSEISLGNKVYYIEIKWEYNLTCFIFLCTVNEKLCNILKPLSEQVKGRDKQTSFRKKYIMLSFLVVRKTTLGHSSRIILNDLKHANFWENVKMRRLIS